MRKSASRAKNQPSYVPIGCYEPVIMGKEDPMICSAFINIVKAAEFAVTGGRDILTGEVFGIETPGRFDEFNDFLTRFTSMWIT